MPITHSWSIFSEFVAFVKFHTIAAKKSKTKQNRLKNKKHLKRQRQILFITSIQNFPHTCESRVEWSECDVDIRNSDGGESTSQGRRSVVGSSECWHVLFYLVSVLDFVPNAAHSINMSSIIRKEMTSQGLLPYAKAMMPTSRFL